MTGQKVQFKSESFQVQEAEDGDGKIVTGLALPYDEKSRNGVKYDKDSVEENMDKMEGRSVLVNHDMDRPIGHVEEVQSTEKGMVYRMNVDPEEKINNTSAIRKFERGDVKNVSISAFVERVEGEKDLVAVKDFAELSAVTVPGFPQTTTNAEDAPTGVMVAESINDWMQEYTEDDGTENFKNKEQGNNTMGDDNDNVEAFDSEFAQSVAEMLAEAADVEVEEFSDVFEDYEFEASDEAVDSFVSEVTEKGDKDSDGDDEADDSGDDDDDDDSEDEAFLEVGDEQFSKEEVIESLKTSEQDDDSDDDEDDDDDSEDESFGDGTSNQSLEGGDADDEDKTKEDFSDVDMPNF